jgi:ATP-dependent Lhr-like helicase
MTKWRTLSSDAHTLLHPAIQRWMSESGWRGLRPVQAQAVEPIQSGRSVIITAPTAGGKTEAAFLPLLGMLADARGPATILAVSPLKALINDQHRRLSEMTRHMPDVGVFRWHGDVASSERTAARRHKRRVILITPESIEAQLQHSGAFVRSVARSTLCVVIDELHVFVDGERGVHLRSLLSRLDQMRNAPAPKIGLSATLAEPIIAQRYLMSHDPERCLVIGEHGSMRLQTQLRAVLEPVEDQEGKTGIEQVAEHIFAQMRGQSNLVFANSKRNVELLTDTLSDLCRKAHVPNEFVAHHGNLSKEIRASVERRLQQGDLPTTAICTSTMELGVDIGDVASVAQVGAPFTVSSLRQRLGRSGRRGGPSILRSYVIDAPATAGDPLLDQLHVELVQAMAMTELMLARWLESPVEHHPHLSTLVHQIMSMLGESGALPAGRLWRDLVVNGAFDVTPEMFRHVLRDLAASDIVYQLEDGLLSLATGGDRIVNKHDFYAAFSTPEEFRVVHGAQTLGTLPLEMPLPEGSALVFAGRRWTVVNMNTSDKVIQVTAGATGQPPKFGGSPGVVDEAVHEQIFRLYTSRKLPTYLDRAAAELAREAYDAFDSAQMTTARMIEEDKDVYLFPWAGDRAHLTLMLWLRTRGVNASMEGIAIRCARMKAENLMVAIESMYEADPPSALDLAQTVAEPGDGKYHHLLSPEIRREEFAATMLDVERAHAALADLV